MPTLVDKAKTRNRSGITCSLNLNMCSMPAVRESLGRQYLHHEECEGANGLGRATTRLPM
jgi:hypothetical protein